MADNTLRNFGIIIEKEYIGKTLTEATAYAKSGGFTTRVTENNGQSFILTMDFRSDRLNFRVNNDIVIGVYGG
jgi:hypothetical protein